MTISAIRTGNIARDKGVNSIIDKALEAVDPLACTQKVFELRGKVLYIHDIQLDLSVFKRIFVIGTGKAVLPMAVAVRESLKERLDSGFLIAKHEQEAFQSELGSTIQVSLGSHPVPSQLSVDSTLALTQFLGKISRDDLVICLISGGGSALMTLPYEGISTTDIQEVNRALLFSGASINEMNAVRKHLDQVKGGGLARMVYPAKLITLVLSDVIGDPLDVIASGPTVADPTTFEDALTVIDKYHLRDEIPAHIQEHLERGKLGEIPETVKEGQDCLQNTATFIIGSLPIAAQAAFKTAGGLGFKTEILTTKLQGEACRVGQELAGKLKAVMEAGDKPVCLIAGGETTVTVKGDGRGGRNQETALSAALALQGVEDCLFISLATDGEDGPTDAAGAFVDGNTIARGKALGMDAEEYLARNDVYTYLEKTGSLIKIGPTGTNVNDLVMMFLF